LNPKALFPRSRNRTMAIPEYWYLRIRRYGEFDMKMIFRKYKAALIWTVILCVIFANLIAYVHAYKFTHFTSRAVPRTKDPKALSVVDKVAILFTGIDNPRPRNVATPREPFDRFEVNSLKKLACWRIQIPQSKGTVVLFHGYAGEKSSLIGRAEEFIKLGYSIVLVDFSGSGGSEGNATSIGFHEAAEVKDVFEFVSKTGESNVILFGTSMGAAAILKAAHEYKIEPSAIILECPFGSLYTTVCARFKMMGVPAVPMAALLTFWGGAQQGYWGFSHNPSRYASAVTSPTLLMFGEQDERVTLQETQDIFSNLKGPKTLKVYPTAGHNVFTEENQSQWRQDVTTFLQPLR